MRLLTLSLLVVFRTLDALRYHESRVRSRSMVLKATDYSGYALLFDCDGVIVETEVNLSLVSSHSLMITHIKGTSSNCI